MDKKPLAQILEFCPRQASAGTTRCLVCGCVFVAYSEFVNPIVECPICGGHCRVGQK